MIKTVYVPLVTKAFPVGESVEKAKAALTKAGNEAMHELDSALDDGWRIIAQQCIDSTYESGVVFFVRDDADCLLVTEEGLDVLASEPLDVGVSDDFPF